ncbi:MAG: CDP-6-deoxy-delta-3,4-glucoseen reductase [Betaproteobacteria bacterium]|nr:CDP-6-deoxy-delta-3,4-glucoseen reductase [Pseudomonadota bacterium]NBQ77107.1 CDP-6-deoxy-delta-3,4-glucoseen reductase [Betaproteobacteria bacterium]NBT80307.1 CDP-6-deoxy-delta-3,4-glucoseen reductase [Betaproteobacteria bacterium]NBY56448.1 CDP-6-deoxy-delta-3,4-glucoseen reductase [Betaproteobacteria bacterium]NDC02771.1 CDP-6-deoxy-delta-3,4-glucoseen reductase [Betaproteobacteria bacterium]
MAWTVTIEPAAKQFMAEPDETLLEAALRQGIVLPYGCKDGACGSCKAKALAGSWEQGAHQPSALKSDEATQGFLLTCCSRASSDLRLECRTVAGIADIPVRKMPSRIASIERAAPDVAIIRLQLPANERLKYLAGQYLEILMRDGSRRAYSMASPPESNEPLELHIRHMPGGKFTDPLFGIGSSTIKEKDILRFEGPLGTFFLREDSLRPMILLASGTGFAPIKAIVEHAQAKGISRPMHLYWGGRRPQDLYQQTLCQDWAERLPHLQFVPVISDALAEDQWEGREGFVHRAVMEDFPDLSCFEVYACGAPVMIDAARKDFVESSKLDPDLFFADAFTSAAD